MPLYVILALSAAFCFSLNGIWAKIASKHTVKNKHALLFYYYLTGFLLAPFVFFFTKIQNPLDGLLPLILFSLTFFIGNFFFYTSLFKYDISILQPFFHFQTIFSVSFAFLFLGERFPTPTYFWILLIIIGGFLVSLNEKLKPAALLSRNFLPFILCIFFFALSDLFARKTMYFMDFYNLRFWSAFIFLIFGLIFIPLAGSQIKISVKQYSPVLVAGIFFFVAYLLFLKAISYNITISQPLAMFGSLFTLLISIGLSKFKPEFLEHHSTKTYALRGLGVLLMLSAAIAISLA